MKTKLLWQGWTWIACAMLLVGCASYPPLVREAQHPQHTTEAIQPSPVMSEPTAHPVPPPPKTVLTTTSKISGSVPMREFVPALGAVTVEYHVWQPLTQTPDVAWRGTRYKMYTYALFNGSVKSSNLRYDERQALLRLGRLLETIGRSEDLATAPENQVRSQQDTNLFLIPSDAPNLTAAKVERYSLGVSRQYLEYFSKALSANQNLHKRLRKNGPFLLSTLKPIGEILKLNADGSFQIDHSQPILLVDMSSAHEKSVAEIVRTFKNHVADAPMTDTTAFEPLRLKLVSLLLKLNDAIPLVSNAVAGSCGLVGAEALCK